jgi:hypothetical protein
MRIHSLVAGTIVGTALLLGLAGTPPPAAANGLTGACCLAHGSCLDGYESVSCQNVGGSYQGDSTECASATCEPVSCGESGSPVCGGTCPSGTRCIDTENLQLAIVISILVAEEEGVSPDSCQCVEVRCGGVPLENGQGCCNGIPFTIGVQGCCNGEIVPVDSECFCGSIVDAQEQIQGPPVDLRENGCCGLGFVPLPPDSSAEQGLFGPTFNVVEQGCCQRGSLDNNLLQNGPVVLGSESTYTFGTGLDCCPGGPIGPLQDLELDLQDALDLAGLCAGTCFGSECATQDCCRCEGCIEEIEGTCISAGSQSTCESLCSTFGCEGATYVANAMCSEDGSCIPSATAAPAASSTGLFILLAALLAVGGFAILSRRKVRG